MFKMIMFAQICFFSLCLLNISNWKCLKKWKKSVGKGNFINRPLNGIWLIGHKLLTGKLIALISFNLPALRLIHDYLSNRKKRIKIKNTCITSMKLYLELRSIQYWDHLLINIALVSLFLIIININIADDNTSYIATDNIDGLIKWL